MPIAVDGHRLALPEAYPTFSMIWSSKQQKPRTEQYPDRVERETAETLRNNEHTSARRAPCNASGCLPEAG
jgi:hypothetical protein